MFSKVLRLWTDEEGLVTVEYALLLAVMVVAAIGTWTSFGAIVREKIAQAGNDIEAIH